MSSEKKFGVTRKSVAAGVSLAVLCLGGGLRAQARAGSTGEKQGAAVQGKFYCNTKALSATERTRHKELTDKLLALRKDVVEGEKGYEFQYSRKEVSLSEIVEWVEAESKCCPFFDFHIDVEKEGTILCLRLTGADGVKAFVRSEFHLGK